MADTVACSEGRVWLDEIRKGVYGWAGHAADVVTEPLFRVGAADEDGHECVDDIRVRRASAATG